MKKKTFPLFRGRKEKALQIYYVLYYNILLAPLVEECCVTCIVGGALSPRRSIPTSAIVATNSDVPWFILRNR